MAKINLLPWREAQRKERQKQFGGLMMLSVIAAGVVMFFVWSTYESWINEQNSRNTLLQGEIAALDKQIEEIKELEKRKAELVTRIEIIQNLQQSRPLIVRLFDTLVRTIPEGVYLTSLGRVNTGLDLKGKTESNNRVSKFMRNIEESTWLGGPVLESITAEKSGATSDFVMKAVQNVPKKPGEQPAGATTPTTAAPEKKS